MNNANCGASKASIDDFRERVAQSLGTSSAVLLNLIDVLAIGPRPASAVEVALSPVWGYGWCSLYQALRRAGQDLGLTIEDPDWLQRLRSARLAWLREQGPIAVGAALGAFRVRILDATNYPRPKTRTVEVGYVHGAEGMKPGHGLSLLSQRVGEGSWTLPLQIAWIPPECGPVSFGVAQLECFVTEQGWQDDEVLAVDAQYTVEPFLRPVHDLGVPVLGRVRSNRSFYLPPPPYRGVGRPRVRGRKLKLNDQRTLPHPETESAWELPTGGRCEVSRWSDLRLRQWPEQPLQLYRVIEYRADGRARYRRPLWLIFVPLQGPMPTPRQAEAIYDERFQIEHSIRFLKQQLGLTAGQFNGPEAEGRLQVWVELVGTAFWFLWALRALAGEQPAARPKWWRSSKLTPGAVRRLGAGLLLSLGWSRPRPKLHGKSPGRARGVKLEPRRRYRLYRARIR
jgi:DDE superfamily endonuclease